MEAKSKVTAEAEKVEDQATDAGSETTQETLKCEVTRLADEVAKREVRIVELEESLAKANSGIDNAMAKIAKLQAAAAPREQEPEIEIKRPKVGVELKFPKKMVSAEKVLDHLNDGDLFQVVLADAGSNVLPAVNFVGGQSILVANGVGDDARLVLIEPIEIDSGNPACSIREAWLLDANGVALSKCRLAVDLVGGGGLAAAIPAKSIAFSFEQPDE